MKTRKKAAPIKLTKDVEREFDESSITFVGGRSRYLREDTGTSIRLDQANGNRMDLPNRVPELLLALGILLCLVSLSIMVAKRSALASLQFDEPARYSTDK